MWVSQWKVRSAVCYLSKFDSVQAFWAEFNRKPVTELADKQHLHIFQEGVAPLWEDPMNEDGGHFKLSARTLESAAALWQTLTLLTIGEQWPDEVHVTGVTFVRHQVGHHTVSVWLSTTDKDVVASAKEFLVGVLPADYYLSHKTAFILHKLVLRTNKRPKGFHPLVRQAAEKPRTPPSSSSRRSPVATLSPSSSRSSYSSACSSSSSSGTGPESSLEHLRRTG
eukprot:EG_transcript_12824